MTDELNAYPTAMKSIGMTSKHKTIKHKAKVYVDGDIHTNTVESAFSLLKRGIIGTWHRICKASGSLPRRNELPLQSSKECQSVFGHTSPHDYGPVY